MKKPRNKRQRFSVRWEFFAALVVVLIALGLELWVNPTAKPSAAKTPDPYYPKASQGATPVPASGSSQPKSTATLQPLPTSSSAAQSSDGHITITAPTQGATVTSGTMVSGRAQVFEGTIHFRLKGSSSGVLAQGSAQVSGDAAVMSPYSFPLNFTNNVCDNNKFCGPGALDTGVLEVFTYSAKDGSEVSLASISVNIKG